MNPRSQPYEGRLNPILPAVINSDAKTVDALHENEEARPEVMRLARSSLLYVRDFPRGLSQFLFRRLRNQDRSGTLRLHCVIYPAMNRTQIEIGESLHFGSPFQWRPVCRKGFHVRSIVSLSALIKYCVGQVSAKPTTRYPPLLPSSSPVLWPTG